MYKGFKEQWQRKFLLAISILLDDQTMKILSFPSRTFYSLRVKRMQTLCFAKICRFERYNTGQHSSQSNKGSLHYQIKTYRTTGKARIGAIYNTGNLS